MGAWKNCCGSLRYIDYCTFSCTNKVSFVFESFYRRQEVLCSLHISASQFFPVDLQEERKWCMPVICKAIPRERITAFTPRVHCRHTDETVRSCLLLVFFLVTANIRTCTILGFVCSQLFDFTPEILTFFNMQLRFFPHLLNINYRVLPTNWENLKRSVRRQHFYNKILCLLR